MKKFLTFLALIVITGSVSAQDSAFTGTTGSSAKVSKHKMDKPVKDGWTKGGNVALTLNQVGNSNWNTAGSDKFTLTTFASVNLFANKKLGRKSWDNNLDVVYGLTNTTAYGIRKVNDRIDFTSKLAIQSKKCQKMRMTLLGQLRSQLTDGFEYNYFGSPEKRRTSGFFAPAYLILAPGNEFRPNSWFSVFGSITALKGTIVTNGPYSYANQGGIFHGNLETPLAALYNVDPAKQHRLELGVFLTASLSKNILKNVSYSSKLDLFSSYIRRREAKIIGFGFNKNVDLFWTNQFKLKVNKWLQVNYNVDLQYDDDNKNPVKPSRPIGLQVLSTLGVGLSVKL